MDEGNLIIRATQGDREAFDELYRKYKRPILNYIYRFIGNLSSAEELTQEAFVRAYINIHRFVPKAKFSSWLYRIAANLSKNYLRHASYEKKAAPVKVISSNGSETELEPVDGIEDKARKPDELVQDKETQELVQEAINKLPAHLKEALILCDIEGLSYEEAANIMKCKAMTVGSRIWRGREKLSKLLNHIKNGK